VNTPDRPLPAGLRFEPEIAADYTVSPDGRTYTFTIRKGSRFSTGAAVTARDVAATINRQLNPALEAPPGNTEPFLGIVGARRVLDGKATSASGITVSRGKLIIRLTKPTPDFLTAMWLACVLPAGLARTAVDPEGLRAPIPSAGPYFVAEHVPGERVVLERNRYYGGTRPRHVDRFEVTIGSDPEALLDAVERGELDYAFTPSTSIGARAKRLRDEYGRNRGRFWVESSSFLRMFVLNTSRPLFRNNPRLRQAVNFAVDRAALVREHGGGLVVSATDQFLMPTKLGFRDERIYPLRGPDVRTARSLARGRTRGGKAVVYVGDVPSIVARAQVLERNLKAIGLDVEIRRFAPGVYFSKVATPGEPFDIAYAGLLDNTLDPRSFLEGMFDGRTIGRPGFVNWSYFDSARVNRLLDRAAALSGESRYRAYGELDVQISRDAAPAVPYAYDNALTLVSARTGCVVVKPYLSLAAVCLK
jgi:ABC-type transport system substrate-binding protein